MGPPRPPYTTDEDAKISIVPFLCRICYDSDKSEVLIAPCHCKGTVAYIHKTCLEKWLTESNTIICELCHEVYDIEPKCSLRKLLGSNRNLIYSLLAPTVIFLTFVCFSFSNFYKNDFNFTSAIQWSSIYLLLVIIVLLIGYYLWIFLLMRWHSRLWNSWCQRENVVRFLPPRSHDNLEIINN